MSHFIDRRPDGSFALFIDGDLQFDSRDEHIYHECLVAPALALAAARLRRSLSVLILGGGDGLAAREVLKSQAVETVELIDLNQQIVELSQSDPALSALNRGSLKDPRLNATIGDAWQFVSSCGKQFDVIYSDLTVPQTQAQTRMHSVEWYALLARALAAGGTMAVNAASTCQTPGAYWSIINSMRKSGLFTRPYRIALPSFNERGYGPDWGFVLASAQAIDAEAMRALDLFQQTGAVGWERLFMMPEKVASFRLLSPPVMAHSNDLLDSLRCRTGIRDPWNADFNCLTANFAADRIPEPVTQQSLLPRTIKDLLLSDEAVVFEQLLDMMPALGHHQTPDTLAELLSAPSHILSTIDLPALVDSLLARAAELPRKAIEELVYLKEALTSINFADIDLARLGARVASIIALVVIIGNLISPDLAYAKGTGGGHAASSFHASSFHASSFHGSSPSALSFHTSTAATAFHGAPIAANHVSHLGVPSSHHVFSGLHPCRPGNGFTHLGLGQRFAISVNGNMYPCRPFRIYSNQYYFNTWQSGYTQSVPVLTTKAAEQIPVYVLGGYTYILPDGTVAILIDDHHSLILGRLCNTIIEIKSGEPLIQLCASAQQNQKVVAQIDDQLAILQQQRQTVQDRLDWANSIGIASITPQDQIELANIVMVQDVLQRSRTMLAVPAPSTVAANSGVAVSAQPAAANAGANATAVAKVETAVDKAAAPAAETPVQYGTEGGAAATETTAVTNEDAAGSKDAVASVKAELQKVDGVEEMFPGVSVDANGRYAIVHLPDGSPAYITGKGWYSDEQLTQLRPEPFPEKFQKFLIAYTKNQERAGVSATTMAEEQGQAATSHLENLLSEKANYQTVEAQATLGNYEDGATVKVHYGTMEIPVKEALTRIASDIASAEQQIVQINQQTHENMTHINMLRSLHETLRHRG